MATSPLVVVQLLNSEETQALGRTVVTRGCTLEVDSLNVVDDEEAVDACCSAVRDSAVGLSTAAVEGVHGIFAIAGANSSVRSACFQDVLYRIAADIVETLNHRRVDGRSQDSLLSFACAAVRATDGAMLDLLDDCNLIDNFTDPASGPPLPGPTLALGSRRVNPQSLVDFIHRSTLCFEDAAAGGGRESTVSARVACVSLHQLSEQGKPQVDFLSHVFIVDAMSFGPSVRSPGTRDDELDVGFIIGAACGAGLDRLLSESVGSNCLAVVALAVGYGSDDALSVRGASRQITATSDTRILLAARQLRDSGALCSPITNTSAARRLLSSQLRRLKTTQQACFEAEGRLVATRESYEAQLLRATQSQLDTQLEAAEAAALSALEQLNAEAERAAADAARIASLERQLFNLTARAATDDARSIRGNGNQRPPSGRRPPSQASALPSPTLSAAEREQRREHGFAPASTSFQASPVSGPDADGTLRITAGADAVAAPPTLSPQRAVEQQQQQVIEALLKRCVALRQLLTQLSGESWSGSSVAETDTAALTDAVLRDEDLEVLQRSLLPRWLPAAPPPSSSEGAASKPAPASAALRDADGKLLSYAALANKVVAAEALHVKMKALLTTASQHIRALQAAKPQK